SRTSSAGPTRWTRTSSSRAAAPGACRSDEWPCRIRAHFGMTTRCPGAMGECETRTQGASIAALLARLRTQDRAAQRGRTARASFRKELLAKELHLARAVGPDLRWQQPPYERVHRERQQ